MMVRIHLPEPRARPLLSGGGLAPLIIVRAARAFGWASLASVLIFVTSLIALPIVIAGLPEDHFVEHPEPARVEGGSIARWMLRNLVGLVLLIAGVVMLAIPGPGVMTILAALAIMQFPGKKRLERRIAAAPHVLGAMNRIRAAARKPPLRLE